MQALQMARPAASAAETCVVEASIPTPGLGEVSIDVEYAGINFMDVMARRGDPGYATGFPYTAGLEIAGVVRQLGEEVSGLAVGDRVAAFVTEGAFAEVAVAPADLTVRVPAGVQLSTAAGAPLMLSAAVLLLEDVTRIRPGESVMMHSASGGLGSAVAQVAGALGARALIGTVGRPDKIEAGLRSGWEHVVVRGEQLIDEARRIAPTGVDVVLDPTGTANLEAGLELTAAGGRIVVFGNPSGSALEPLPPMARLLGGNVGVTGFSIRRLRVAAPARVAGALRRALQLLESGAADQEVTVVDGLAEVPSVHDLLATGHGTGKYVVRIGRA